MLTARRPPPPRTSSRRRRGAHGGAGGERKKLTGGHRSPSRRRARSQRGSSRHRHQTVGHVGSSVERSKPRSKAAKSAAGAQSGAGESAALAAFRANLNLEVANGGSGYRVAHERRPASPSPPWRRRRERRYRGHLAAGSILSAETTTRVTTGLRRDGEDRRHVAVTVAADRQPVCG